jgi:hypothetical protein
VNGYDRRPVNFLHKLPGGQLVECGKAKSASLNSVVVACLIHRVVDAVQLVYSDQDFECSLGIVSSCFACGRCVTLAYLFVSQGADVAQLRVWSQ